MLNDLSHLFFVIFLENKKKQTKNEKYNG